MKRIIIGTTIFSPDFGVMTTSNRIGSPTEADAQLRLCTTARHRPIQDQIPDPNANGPVSLD